jgi:Sulfotransferase family
MTSPRPKQFYTGRSPGNSFVLRDQKIVYMSVTKVACTALRWMVADLSGEDLESFYPALGAHQSRLMTVHREREHWQNTPQVFNIPREERPEISRDNGWFIFAVVRDPWSRLWSAWQSKFLVQHRPYVENYGTEPWFPRVPEKPQDVIDDFRAFVEASPWLTHERLSKDVHFLPQVVSVRPDDVRYTKVYDLRELSLLLADIHTHLKTVGQDKELYLPRSNETPLPLIPAVLENGVAERIEKLYRADFDRYGDRWSLDTVKMQDSWSDDAIRFAAYHTVANQRIGDLRDSAWKLRRELKMANARIGKLEAEKAAAPHGVRLLVAQVRHGLAWRVRRLKRRLRKTG